MAYHVVSSSNKRQKRQKHLELTMMAAWMLGSCHIFQEYQNIAFLLGYFLAALLLITLSWSSTFILQHIKIHNNWVGVHSQQTEGSEPAWEPCLCELAHRGVLTLSSWWSDLPIFLKSINDRALTGIFWLRVLCCSCSCTACWKACLHEADFSWGVSSALSSSNSTPWVAIDIHKRPCQISFLIDLIHFGNSGLLRCLWAAAGVAAE